MKRSLKKILGFALVVSFLSVNLHAEPIRYTNKTFLAPRPHGVNLALENSGGWYELIHHRIMNDEAFGGKTQTAAFYQESINENGLGKYFGIKKKNSILTATGSDVATTPNVDFDLGLIIHDQANATNPVATVGAAGQGTIKFQPTQKAYGALYTFEQDLSKALKNLYFRLTTVLVRVDTDMELIAGGQKADVIQKFFNGTLSNPVGDANAQDILKHARIGSQDSATGFADIDLMLGYNVHLGAGCLLGLNLGVTIPTGNKVTGEKVFEATYGNGRHVGFGGNLEFMARLWGNDEHNMKLIASANYRYLFENTQRRTLGIVGQDFGQYVLLGDNTRRTSDNKVIKQLIPAANVLTQDVFVRPGSQVDGIVALAYNIKGFALDVGYNFYCREGESVRRKEKFDATQVGIALQNLDVKTVGDDFVTTNFANNAFLTDAQIDTSAAETPGQASHKFYGGIAYLFKDWETPMSLGLGGHYEFAARNNALETWGVFAKLGFAF